MFIKRNLKDFVIQKFPDTEARRILIERFKCTTDLLLEVAYEEIMNEFKEEEKHIVTLDKLYNIYSIVRENYFHNEKVLSKIAFSRTMVNKGFFNKSRKNTGMYCTIIGW